AAGLLQWIEQSGTWVCRLPGPPILWLMGLPVLGLNAGFNLPSSGTGFRFLLWWCDRYHRQGKDALAQGVFLLPQGYDAMGSLAHQLHHWLAFRSGLPGYDDQAKRLYRDFWEKHKGVVDPTVKDWSLEDLTQLQAAVKRD